MTELRLLEQTHAALSAASTYMNKRRRTTTPIPAHQSVRDALAMVEAALKQAGKSSVERSPRARAKSDVLSPVKIVWQIANEMEGASRLDIIAACVNAGVNRATATTQYHKWSRARTVENTPPPANDDPAFDEQEPEGELDEPTPANDE